MDALGGYPKRSKLRYLATVQTAIYTVLNNKERTIREDGPYMEMKKWNNKTISVS